MAYSLDCGESASDIGKVNVRICIFGYERKIILHRKNRIRRLCLNNAGVEGDTTNSIEFFNKVVTGLPNIFKEGVWHFAGCGTVPIFSVPKYADAWLDIVRKYNYFRSTFGAWAFPRGWTIYAHLLYSEPKEQDKVMAISDEINKKFFGMGLVPYGIGGPEGLQPYILKKWGTYYELLRKIKRCLDPNNILQPGILIEGK